MSSDSAFWRQFEKLVYNNGWTMDNLRTKFCESGDGFRERFEKISKILLIKDDYDHTCKMNPTNKEKATEKRKGKI